MQRDAIYERIKYIFYNNNFTYMRSPNGKFKYNCTIIDLFDRSVVASMNGKYINSELAIETPARAFRFRITKKAPHTTLRVWSCGRLNLLPILLQKKNK